MIRMEQVWQCKLRGSKLQDAPLRPAAAVVQVGLWIDAAVPNMPHRAELLLGAHEAGQPSWSPLMVCRSGVSFRLTASGDEAPEPCSAASLPSCICRLLASMLLGCTSLTSATGRPSTTSEVSKLYITQCSRCAGPGSGVLAQPKREVSLDRWAFHTEVQLLTPSWKQRGDPSEFAPAANTMSSIRTYCAGVLLCALPDI